MQMDIIILIKSGIGLLAILAILMFFMIFIPKSKEKKRKNIPTKATPKIDFDFNHLRAIIKNKKSSTEKLKETIDLILKYHGTIHPKLGIRAHPDFDMYMEIIMHLSRHPNTNKDLILQLDKELVRRNPEYKVEINEALTKGLNSRGL
jgi:hypothetical protein